jgi:hypothetical protein
MCAKDLRPFSFVEKEGSLQLAQKLLNIGQQYGKIDAKDVIPTAQTVSNHVNDVYDKLIETQKRIPKYSLFWFYM